MLAQAIVPWQISTVLLMQLHLLYGCQQFHESLLVPRK